MTPSFPHRHNQSLQSGGQAPQPSSSSGSIGFTGRSPSFLSFSSSSSLSSSSSSSSSMDCEDPCLDLSFLEPEPFSFNVSSSSSSSSSSQWPPSSLTSPMGGFSISSSSSSSSSSQESLPKRNRKRKAEQEPPSSPTREQETEVSLPLERQLRLAVNKARIDQVQSLLRQGADLFHTDLQGNNIIWKCAWSIQGRDDTKDAKLENILKIFVRATTSFDKPNRFGITPTLRIAMNAATYISPNTLALPKNPNPIFSRIVKYLLENKAGPNATFENKKRSECCSNGMSLLHMAVCAQDEEMVKTVLAFRADVSQPVKDVKGTTFWGKTALHFAAALLDDKIVTLLIDNRAPLNVGDGGPAKATPLMVALASLRHRNVEVLVAKGAHVGETERTYWENIADRVQKERVGDVLTKMSGYTDVRIPSAIIEEENLGILKIQQMVNAKLRSALEDGLQHYLIRDLIDMVFEYCAPLPRSLREVLGIKASNRDAEGGENVRVKYSWFCTHNTYSWLTGFQLCYSKL